MVSTIRLRIQFHWSARATTIGTRAFMSCGPCTHLRPLRLFSLHFHINKRPLHPTLSTRFVALAQGPCTSFRVRKTKIKYSKSIRKIVYRKNRLTITWNQQFDIICWLRSHIHSWFIIVIPDIDRWTCFCRSMSLPNNSNQKLRLFRTFLAIKYSWILCLLFLY